MVTANQLYSVERTDNAAMRELAHELGMSAACDADDAHQVISSLEVWRTGMVRRTIRIGQCGSGSGPISRYSYQD